MPKPSNSVLFMWLISILIASSLLPSWRDKPARDAELSSTSKDAKFICIPFARSEADLISN